MLGRLGPFNAFSTQPFHLAWDSPGCYPTVKGHPETGFSVGFPVTVPEEFSAGDSTECHLILPPRAECLQMASSPAQKSYSQESDKFTQLKPYCSTIHPPIHFSIYLLSICLFV